MSDDPLAEMRAKFGHYFDAIDPVEFVAELRGDSEQVARLTAERDEARVDVAVLREELGKLIAASERARRAEDAWARVGDDVYAGGVPDEVLKAASDELEDADASLIICEHTGHALLATPNVGAVLLAERDRLRAAIVAYRTAVKACDGWADAEQALFAALGEE